MSTIVERFFKYVLKTDTCWLWTGSLNSNGYGQISQTNGKGPKACHRLSYEIHKGDIQTGLIVRHTCDNPVCVNPDHLILGTKADNTRDAIERQRFKLGENRTVSKLTNQESLEILDLLHCKLFSNRKIAAMYDVSETCVRFIGKGKIRSTITGIPNPRGY